MAILCVSLGALPTILSVALLALTVSIAAYAVFLFVAGAGDRETNSHATKLLIWALLFFMGSVVITALSKAYCS